MGFMQSAWDDLRGKTAANEAKAGARLAAGGVQEQQDYLREVDAPLRHYRENALSIMANELGIPSYSADGSTPAAPEGGSLINQAQQSPLYQAIIDASRSAGESAIARTASATSGLRGGAAISDLAGFGKDLEAQALMQAYNDKKGYLSGLTGTQSYAPQIAQSYGDIGSILAQGNTAAANARQQGMGNILSGGLQIGGALLGGPVGGVLAGGVI